MRWAPLLLLIGCATEVFPPVEAVSVPNAMVAPTGLVISERVREVTLRNRDAAEVVLSERVRAVVVDAAQANERYRMLVFEGGRLGEVQRVLARRSRSDGDGPILQSNGQALDLGALSNGDVLDWHVTYLNRDPEVFPPVVGSGPEPALRVSLRAVVEDSFSAEVRFGVQEVVDARHSGAGRFERHYRDVPALRQGEFSLHPQRIGPWMLLVAKAGESGDALVDYASSWAQVARRVERRGRATSSAETPAQLARGSARLRFGAVRRLLRPSPAALFERVSSREGSTRHPPNSPGRTRSGRRFGTTS